MYNQRTIGKPVKCIGLGLHTGKKVSLKIIPAPVNTGIIFSRVDLPSTPSIKAAVENIVGTDYATTIGNSEARISTIEHLMASFAGLGIDNAFVEVDAPEVPVMDGSAAPLIFLLKSGGIRVQGASKKFLVIKKAIAVMADKASATILPAKSFRISCDVDFKHPILKKQSFDINFSDTSFEKEVSKARTFGFLKDVENMRNSGLIKGGSLDNAVVVDDFRVVNEGGLRYKDEFVRHKVLDAIGDISMLGMPIIGHLKLYRPGHGINYKLASEVISSPESWKIVEVNDENSEKLRFKIPHFGVLSPTM